MTDQLSGSEAAKAVADPLGTVAGWLAGLLPEGPVRTLLYVVVGLCAAAAPFIYRYYLGVLAQGAQPEGSLERQDYGKLRASLAGGNLAARLYAKWLTAFLEGIERFFCDADTEGQCAFGLKKPVPLWTAPAFDRCLFLALIYPIVTIFVIWAISGHVGPAEAALGLRPDVSGWARGILAAFMSFCGFANWRVAQTRGWKHHFLRVIVVVAFVGAVAFAGAGVSGVLSAFVVASAVALAGSVAVAFVLASGVVVAFVLASGVVVAGFVAAGVAGAVGVSLVALIAMAIAFVVAILLLSNIAIKHRWQGAFLSVFLSAMILACLGLAAVLSPLKSWGAAGSLLLFLGLLTLLNAPFDWASLGLTRALLRRGLELGGWWPYLLAVVDAVLAGVIVALLAMTMVLSVQAFDELAAHGGGKSVLPLDVLFDGIAKNPAAPEYWWVYALLLSSMIPSLINLAIGGMALTRGIPGLARLLLQSMPEGKAVPEYKQQPAAIGLTVQMFAGAGLGIAAQGLLAFGIIYYVIPLFGSDLLDMARAVADFDLPARVAQLFTGVR